MFRFALILFFLLSFQFVFGSTTNGTIDSTFKYAKIESGIGGYINFGATQGNVHVTDSGLTGYAWGENIGWINLNPTLGGVLNDAEGNLSGYAWGERIGWINFNPTNSGVVINSSGEFTGYAWGERIGWISFNCSNDSSCGSDNYKVVTDWRPESVRNGSTPTPSPSPGGSGGPIITPPIIPPVVPSITPPFMPPLFLENINPQNPPNNNDQEDRKSDIISGTENTNSDPIRESIIDVWRNAGSSIKEQILNTKGAFYRIYENQNIDDVTKILTISGIALVALAGIFNVLLTTASLSEIVLLPIRLWTLIASFLGLKKKSKPWGTVYDSITKQPLDPAYVVLRDSFGKEINTSITDLDGRYGFLSTNGTYTIVANKTNYTFPSKRLSGRIADELYTNLYFGENIDVTDGFVINRNIPLDPTNFDWNEFAKSDKKLMRFYSKSNRFILRLSDWLFRIGALIAITSLFASPEIYNVVIFIVYAVLFVLRRLGLKPKTFGTIFDSSGQPLSFAIIRVFSNIANTEITQKVADKYGRYYCLVPKGHYSLRIEKKNLDESYTSVLEIPQVDASKGIINEKFVV